MATIVRHGKRFESQDRSDPLNHVSIGVLYGGPSAEREVSIQSGEAVATALIDAGRTVHRVVLDGSFDVKIAQSLDIDVAFLALHGEFGEDGRVQAILEEAGVPYTGSDPDSSSLAFDKLLAKRAYEENGICTPAWMCYEREEIEDLGGPDELDVSPPVVIKPATSGSSLGITIVRHLEQVAPAIEYAFNFSDSIVVERFVSGRELSVPVLGKEPLPVIELRVNAEFYDFAAKYQDESTQYICPADLPRELTNRVQAAALAAHMALGCRDLSRTDIILDEHGMPWVLETNTLPGMTSHSLVPKSADTVGTSFVALCEYLLMCALERKSQGGHRRVA